MQPRLRIERDGPVGRLVLDNPARRNAISAAMWAAIPPAVEAFGADPSIGCVVLRGEGTAAFAAGADISEFETQRSGEAAVAAYDALVEGAQHALEHSAKPVIALIHGFCIGGGLELALACDLRYAAASARFAIPAARLGVGYGVPGTLRLVATVGHAAAREIMYTGRRYDAAEALALGLVNRVLADADLDAYVAEAAAQIAGNAPLSIRASKSIIDTATRIGGDFAEGAALARSCMHSEDYREGRRAFLEKRPARFSGR